MKDRKRENMYRYTECGLDYVYLKNGYTVHKTPYGKGVSIQDADDLHETIARSVITTLPKLRGQEVRFLRSLLDLSQTGLARVLQTTRASVARWEADRGKPIPGPADSALRMFYALKAGGDQTAIRTVGLLAEIDEIEHADKRRRAVFQETDGSWMRNAA
jgi:DNA-binding transcriptional regulator YiaG